MSEDDDARTLVEAFRQVARVLRARSVAVLAPYDVTPAQARALDVVGRLGPLRPGELSAQLHVAPRSATEFVDALERRGLVHRVPDPHDRRATLVERTRAGDELTQRVEADRAAGAAALFDRLGDRDRRTLARILRTLAADPAAGR